jgi:branched-chain amino acid transport system permease protein
MDYAAVVLLEIIYMIAFLALTSAGLAVVFGMMRVINLAHGEFVMIGGYTTIACAKADINIYFAMLVISPLVVGILGLLVERLVVRQLYGRMIDTMLATWGLSLLMVGIVTFIFGNTAVSVPAPIPGYELGEFQMGGYNLFIIGIATLLMLCMWLVMRFTRLGWLRVVRCKAPMSLLLWVMTRRRCTCGPSPWVQPCLAWPVACWHR